MKSFRSTWLFAALVIAFAVYVYYFEYVKEEQLAEKKEEAKKLVQVDQEKIEQIQLVLKGKPLTLKKNDGEWRLNEPLDDLAEQSTVTSVLNTLTSAKGENVVSGNEADLKEFGLVEPKGEIIVEGGGEKFHYLVGTVTSYENEYYVKPKNEDTVTLVESSFADLLDKPIKDLRDKQVFRQKLGDVERLKFDQSKADFELVKRDGQWTIAGDVSAVHQQEVISYLQTLNDLVAVNFSAEDHNEKAKFGLAKPRLVVTTGEQTLTVGQKTDGKYHVMTSQRPVVLEVADWRIDKLLKTADDFKDKAAPFKFDTSQVKRIRLAAGKTALDLQKEGESWKLANPPVGKELDPSQVVTLISQIGSLKAKSFLGSEPGKGLKPPKNRVILTGDDGKSLLELMWGQSFQQKEEAKNGELYYVKTNQSSETLGVPVSSLDGLPLSSLLRDKKADKAAIEKGETENENSRREGEN